jgi:hypothetical protein
LIIQIREIFLYFLLDKVAQLLHLPIIRTKGFSVKVANGGKLQCQGKREQVVVAIQDIPFVITLYSLQLKALDVVMGIQWLELLDSHLGHCRNRQRAITAKLPSSITIDRTSPWLLSQTGKINNPTTQKNLEGF